MSDDRCAGGNERRLWKCTVCGETKPRHWNEKQRPFCDECESREAVLIEMSAYGPGSGEFYSNNEDRSLHTDNEQ